MSSVDVIVPCYRYGHFLRACVEHVLNQQISDLRILIIDDASPDNTAEVAAELMKGDHRVEFLRHRKNIGHLATYNEGLEWVSAEYMLLLSADDVVLPGALIRAAEVIDGHPEVGMTFGRVIYFPAGFAVSQFSEGKVPIRPASFQKAAAIIDDSAEARDFVETDAGPAAARGGSFIEGPFGATDLGYRILGTAEFMRSCRHSNQVHTATAIVRSAVQKSIGGYRMELPRAGDMEMWLRFAIHAPVAYIDSYQAASRVHGNKHGPSAITRRRY